MQSTTLTEPVTFRCRPNAIAAIKAYAEADDVTKSSWIAKALYRELVRRNERAGSGDNDA
jgi:CelD/BcsL family acetyltransferase involved in cellulose biosynthesis